MLFMIPRFLFWAFMIGFAVMLHARVETTKKEPIVFPEPEASDRIAAIIENMGLGIKSRETEHDIERFILKQGPQEFRLSIPKQHITSIPNRSGGEMDVLDLAFYLPDMQSRQEVEHNSSEREMRQLEVSVSLTAKASRNPCWGKQCLGPAFAGFQIELYVSFFRPWFEPNDIEGSMQRLKEVKPNAEHPVRRLEKGKLDPVTGWIMYHSAYKNEVAKGQLDFDRIYLRPGSNPCHPKEWLSCSGYKCYQQWARNGMGIKSQFYRKLLPYHAQIREKIDRKLDEFIDAP